VEDVKIVIDLGVCPTTFSLEFEQLGSTGEK
jgi:hypothetical protein